MACTPTPYETLLRRSMKDVSKTALWSRWKYWSVCPSPSHLEEGESGVCAVLVPSSVEPPISTRPFLRTAWYRQSGTFLEREGCSPRSVLMREEMGRKSRGSILLWKLDFLLGARLQIWYLLSGNWIHCFSKPLFKCHCPLESLVCPLNWLTPNQKMVCTFVIPFVFLTIKTVVPDSFLRDGLLYWLFVFLLKWI